MGRSKEVVLDSISFENQKTATLFFRAMLNKYIPGDRVSVEDYFYLEDLFKRHPEYSIKVGPGVDYFEVMAADYATQCFRVVRLDGKKDRFSFNRCITQKAD